MQISWWSLLLGWGRRSQIYRTFPALLMVDYVDHARYALAHEDEEEKKRNPFERRCHHGKITVGVAIAKEFLQHF